MIWVNRPSLENINTFFAHSMERHMEIKITEVTDNAVIGSLEVSERNCQPIGILHGGASAAFAESLANLGSHLTIDLTHSYSLCADLNISHLRPTRKGMVTGTATPVHLGRRSQVWNVDLRDASDQLIAVAKVTKVVIEHKDKYNIVRERLAPLMAT